MYMYLKVPTAKKPIAELDPTPWMSAEHPTGEVLRKLLEFGQRSNNALRKRRGGAVRDETGGKRLRVTDICDIVRESGVRQALVLQAKAEETARSGDDALAKFCTSHGTLRLQEHLNAAWAVLDAPKKLQAPPTRIEKLRDCALSRQCTCGGVWKAGAALVLQDDPEDTALVGRDVCCALAVGARRGVHMGIVGVPGCGKSMLFQPLEDIFELFEPRADVGVLGREAGVAAEEDAVARRLDNHRRPERRVAIVQPAAGEVL